MTKTLIEIIFTQW